MPIRRRLLALALLLALSFLTSIPVPPAHAAWTLWYVDDTGTNSPACGTAVDPCRTIQYAIDKALDGDALSVAAGTYSTAATGEIFPITISKSISLHGAGRAITTIDAASAGLYVISASGNMNVYIDNFTIRGGIRGIDLQGAYPGVITGGIEDNSITGNSVGIYSYSTQVSVRANDISGNVHKGVHFVGSSNAVIAQNIFGWNGSGVPDAAIYNDFSNLAITNNLVGWNNGHGIYNNVAEPVITNNTIALNLGGSGIANVASNPTVTNNIVVGNGLYGVYADPGSTSLNTYNDVWGNFGGDYFGTSAGAGSISADPKFVDLFDAHLLCSSPAIDHGNNGAPGVPSVDYDGNPRPVGGTVDMGAYEWQSALRCAAFLPAVLR